MNNEMMIRTMDPMLIRIYQIKDIEEISYQDLVPSSNEGKINVLPSLYVTYDGGKYLSLCSQDKYFDVFVRKVFQVYNLEKDRVIVDPDFDPFGSRTKLRIDDRTKAILESGNLTRINEIYCFYDQKKSYENSLVFQNDKLKLLLPVIKYHLKQLFDCTDRVITMEETLINGYRNNYGIMYKLDGVIDTLLINFINNSDNEYFLNIRSKDKRFKPIEMRIKFNKTSIDVDTYFKDYDLNALFQMIALLPREQQLLLQKVYGENYSDFFGYQNLTKQEIKKFYQVRDKMKQVLSGSRRLEVIHGRGRLPKSIMQFFDSYTYDEIITVIESLSEKEKKLLQKAYGIHYDSCDYYSSLSEDDKGEIFKLRLRIKTKLKNNRIDFKPFISGVYSIDNTIEGFEANKSKESLKILLKFD